MLFHSMFVKDGRSTPYFGAHSKCCSSSAHILKNDMQYRHRHDQLTLRIDLRW